MAVDCCTSHEQKLYTPPVQLVPMRFWPLVQLINLHPYHLTNKNYPHYSKGYINAFSLSLVQHLFLTC